VSRDAEWWKGDLMGEPVDALVEPTAVLRDLPGWERPSMGPGRAHVIEGWYVYRWRSGRRYTVFPPARDREFTERSWLAVWSRILAASRIDTSLKGREPT
jgi:hypothetical protein